MSNNPITYPDYTNSILNVSNSLLDYYHITPHHPTHPVLDQYLSKPYNHIVYVLLDGLGTNVIKAHLTKQDALYQYMQDEITSVFPPTTVAATNAVISGKTPIENGHLGWVQYFEKEDTNLIVFKNEDFYTGHIQPSNLRAKYLSYNRLVDQVSTKNPDITCQEFMPQIVTKDGSKTFENQVERILLHTHHHDKTFSYVYWIEPDMSEHQYGVYSDEVNHLINELNQSFTSLIQNLPEDTLVIGIADHGLTDIESLPLYQNKKLVSLLKRKTSIEPRATNFFIKDGQKDTFEKVFNASYQDDYLLLSKQEILDEKLFGSGKSHPMIHSFLGDYIAIATSNKMFSLTDKKVYKAHHAGLTQDEMMVPLIIYKK
ncbi:MAG: alkaline phosphatase family protein [Candidatus Izimaplasma sp.]|nr:alkaline phosphatase family protein [Candidatus Izimaplasma bacterium]